MFRNVDCRAAVLAAERKTLQNANGKERDRREPASSLICGQDADNCRSATHDGKSDQEGVFAAHNIADPSEEQGSEGPNDKSDRERS